jgi:hypothetical protein
MGTATGPPLYGLAIGAEVQNAFMIFASVVIGLPIAWQATRGSGKEKRR